MKNCICISFAAMIVIMVLTAPCYATTPLAGQDEGILWKQIRDFQINSRPIDVAHSLDGNYAFILTNSRQVFVYNQVGKLVGKIPVAEGVSAIDIAPRGELLYLIDSINNKFTTLLIDYIAEIDTSTAPIKGNSDAPITITVFSDFQCPYCKNIAPILDQVLSRNPDTVKIAFKNLPLQMHEMALPAALAALAAHEQGKFWEFHDRLFAEQSITSDSFNAIATALRLDLERFNADMNSPVLRERINKDITEANVIGITGTPTVFINGKKVRQLTLEGLEGGIKRELDNM